MNDVIIVGAGIGGLTLALTLQHNGIPARVYEAAPAIRPLGVGINILPHAAREFGRLGLEPELTRRSVLPRETAFFNRFGQLIYSGPLGRSAGHDAPQYSIHRGELQMALLEAVQERLGADRIMTGWKCVRVEQTTDGGAAAHFEDPQTGAAHPPQRGAAVIGCDGLNSTVRRQLHPHEGPPIYSGVTMWRGTTRWAPILSGATMIRAGWLTPGKLVIYPIQDNIDGSGKQLVNWVAEIETPERAPRDWNRTGSLDDFAAVFDDCHFDWLDVPAFLAAADIVLEFPMVDQDPLPWWTDGCITLLGDAAHPMYPRGSNGAGQAILDARVLADCLIKHASVPDALADYELQRLPATTKVVLTNRTNPPDAIIREVYLRSGDKPFSRIEDVISRQELTRLLDEYERATDNVRPRS